MGPMNIQHNSNQINAINAPRPMGHQQMTGMVNLNTGEFIPTMQPVQPAQMNTPRPMIQPKVINPNQMNTGMINLNTGEFIPNMQPMQQQMNTEIVNFNTTEFMPSMQPMPQPQMNTGVVNFNTPEFMPMQQAPAPIIVPQPINPNQMNTGMINLNQQNNMPRPIIVPTDTHAMATNLINLDQQSKNNPFYDPSMNTFEFDFTNGSDDLSSDYFGKIEIDLKLEELQRIYNSNLISSEEYIIKKKDLVKKALDKL